MEHIRCILARLVFSDRWEVIRCCIFRSKSDILKSTERYASTNSVRAEISILVRATRGK